MKKIILMTIYAFATCNAFAQALHLNKDTIYSGSTPYAIFKKWSAYPHKYSFSALNGKDLIIVHPAGINIKGLPGYCVTFLNDNRKAMMVNNAPVPAKKIIIKEIVINKLIANGSGINEQAENEHIKSHPLPPGYTDIEDLIDY